MSVHECACLSVCALRALVQGAECHALVHSYDDAMLIRLKDFPAF